MPLPAWGLVEGGIGKEAATRAGVGLQQKQSPHPGEPPRVGNNLFEPLDFVIMVFGPSFGNVISYRRPLLKRLVE